MIPEIKNNLLADVEYEDMPSFTHKIVSNDHIKGYCDHLEAMKQVIYKILSTERYHCLIYSWNYGIELNDLYGKPTTYCIPEIERRITEALMQDERILSVHDFDFDTPQKGVIFCSFSVDTIYGKVESEVNVSV